MSEGPCGSSGWTQVRILEISNCDYNYYAGSLKIGIFNRVR